MRDAPGYPIRPPYSARFGRIALMRINEHADRLRDVSGAIQIGEVLRQVGLGHVGEVLL